MTVRLLFLIFLLLAASTAFADRLPDNADVKLHRILSGSEYQPRTSSRNFWWELIGPVLNKVGDALANLLKTMPSIGSSDFWLWRVLQSVVDLVAAFFAFLARISNILLILALLLLLGLVGLKLLSHVRRTSPRESVGSDRPDASNEYSLEELLGKIRLGNGLETIAAIRSYLRRKTAHYGSATTDREVLRKMPESNLRGLFQQVVMHHEDFSYAGNPIRPEVVLAVTKEFNTLRSQGAI